MATAAEDHSLSGLYGAPSVGHEVDRDDSSKLWVWPLDSVERIFSEIGQ